MDTQQVDVQRHADGDLLAAISAAMVGAKKALYGKGPTKAKTFINDDYVFCVMEGGLNRNEETMLEAGHDDVVRDYRLRFQETTADQLTGAVERLTGRTVIGYHSQITFRPTRVFEIFVLEPTSNGPAARGVPEFEPPPAQEQPEPEGPSAGL